MIVESNIRRFTGITAAASVRLERTGGNTKPTGPGGRPAPVRKASGCAHRALNAVGSACENSLAAASREWAT